MSDDERHERIRQLAHELWERAGRPEGQDAEHWRMAKEAIEPEPETATQRGRTPKH